MSSERWLLVAAMLAWGVSLALPAVQVTRGPSLSGYDVLVQGAGAWRDGVVAWYANPALLGALVLGWVRAHRASLVVAVIGLALGLSSFSAGTVAASAGRSVPAFGFAAGFYLWLVAFGLVVLAGGVAIYKVSKHRYV
jgi:hypothetical protein